MFGTETLYTIAAVTQDGPISGFVSFELDGEENECIGLLVFSDPVLARSWASRRNKQDLSIEWHVIDVPADQHCRWLTYGSHLSDQAVINPQLDKPESGVLFPIMDICRYLEIKQLAD